MLEPPEEAREDPDLNRTFAVRHKAAKRSLPWDLVGEELELISRRQESEDIRAATKKPRLEEPFSASTDEVAAERSSHDTAINLPVADSTQADGDRSHWTLEEDAKLKYAVQLHGGKNWGSIAALVPGRTRKLCSSRWKDISNSNIDRVIVRAGKWTADEDSKLNDAVQTHGDKNWDAIAVLVTGRTGVQCRHRWRNVLDPNIDRATGRDSSRRQLAAGCATHARWQECRLTHLSSLATIETLKLKRALQSLR
jgi:hypothetical protein